MRKNIRHFDDYGSTCNENGSLREDFGATNNEIESLREKFDATNNEIENICNFFSKCFLSGGDKGEVDQNRGSLFHFNDGKWIYIYLTLKVKWLLPAILLPCGTAGMIS